MDGASGFLPGSQVDIRPVRDVAPLMNKEQPFAILKMDRPRGNIVVSRRAILEEARAEQRTELVGQLAEGEIRDGVVKNITDYGAFVDLGGIDGLLHVTDMSWKRVSHPSQVLNVGDSVRVQIIKINPDTQRISLGMKQLQSDPWENVDVKYPVGGKFSGRITNITDYGIGRRRPWSKCRKCRGPRRTSIQARSYSTSQEVEVVVLEVDASKRRVSLGPQAGSGKSVGAVRAPASGRLGHRGRSQERHRIRPVRRLRERHRRHGPPVGPRPGTCRARKPSPSTRRAMSSRTKVLDVDVDKERISLGIKQLGNDPMTG